MMFDTAHVDLWIIYLLLLFDQRVKSLPVFCQSFWNLATNSCRENFIKRIVCMHDQDMESNTASENKDLI